FRGWGTHSTYTTEEMAGAMSIDDVRADLTTRLNGSFHNNDEVHYYAVLVKHHTVTYYDEDNAVIASKEVPYPYGASSSIPYEIDMDYTPRDDEHSFVGWSVISGANYVSGYQAGNLYEVGDSFTLSGDVIFLANAPLGTWLIFEELEKGATYNAPQFVKSTDVTQRPIPDAEMKCLGYTFGGWYTDRNCTTGNEFTFGQRLTERTTIYAKWTPNATANYTVIIWKQNLAGDGYDFEQSLSLTGSSNQNVSSIVQVNSGDRACAQIDGTSYQYTGFHLKEFDQNVKVDPKGNTVVNVYYDRNQHTLTFAARKITQSNSTSSGTYLIPQGDGYVAAYLRRSSGGTWYRRVFTDRYDGTDYYGDMDNERDGYYYIYNPSTNRWERTYLYYFYGHYYRGYSDERYYGNRYKFSSDYVNVKEITALYQQPIGNNFPIVGNDGVVYDDGEVFEPNNSYTFSDVLVYIDVMPDEDITFKFSRNVNPVYEPLVMHFYVEALPTETPTRIYKGMGFVEYNSFAACYNFFTEAEDYLELSGYDKGDKDGGPYVPEGTRNGTPTDVIWWTSGATNTATEIWCYYTRQKYTINYKNGVFVDGNDNLEAGHPEGELLHEVSGVTFGSDLSSYNEG
ncbi:MAG: InlB B-repeat-containing protein, partial [Paludibacteraceae bacterium]|nr:InlB B-repeat-containing protein [Paludibacteraceae bacterium]